MEALKNDIQNSFAKDCLSDTNAMILSNLLFAAHANDAIANSSVDQFKLKLFSIVFKNGANWAKKLEVQKKVHELSDDELIVGQRQISNRANNVGLNGTKAELEELEQVDDQSSTTIRRSKVEAYSSLLAMLDDDFTDEFIDRFKPLFNPFSMPQNPILYDDDEEDEL